MEDRRGWLVFLSGLRFAFLFGMPGEDSEQMDHCAVFQRNQINRSLGASGMGVTPWCADLNGAASRFPDAGFAMSFWDSHPFGTSRAPVKPVSRYLCSHLSQHYRQRDQKLIVLAVFVIFGRLILLVSLHWEKHVTIASLDRTSVIKRRLETREARIGMVGMGYVGLPLALLFSEARFRVTGFDIDSAQGRDAQSERFLHRAYSGQRDPS